MSEYRTCPACESTRTRVLDTRRRDGRCRRRIACHRCEHRWNTYETPAHHTDPEQAAHQLALRRAARRARAEVPLLPEGVALVLVEMAGDLTTQQWATMFEVPPERIRLACRLLGVRPRRTAAQRVRRAA